MAKNRNRSPGAQLVERARKGVREHRRAPLEGARDLYCLHNLSKDGSSTIPLENLLIEAVGVLVGSKRVFRYGADIMLVVDGDASNVGSLVPLCTGFEVEAGAGAFLANIIVGANGDDDGNEVQFALPPAFVRTLLTSDILRRRLPRIKLWAQRPVYDENLRLLQPGWHPESGVMVEGLPIEVVPPDYGSELGTPAPDAQQPHLREVLRDFCFSGQADRTNFVAFLLTGMLAHHFIQDGKPLGLIDGNQPGIGKTLLVDLLGVILDGVTPRRLRYTANEDELEKRILATLRRGPESLLFIDNARVQGNGALQSAVIELNSTAPTISIRILGTSTLYTQANDRLWVISMNATRANPDLVDRALPIRLSYEGDPKVRDLGGRDPLSYARQHRREILEELVAMIEQWNACDRPHGKAKHRLARWASEVGGILDCNRFPNSWQTRESRRQNLIAASNNLLGSRSSWQR